MRPSTRACACACHVAACAYNNVRLDTIHVHDELQPTNQHNTSRLPKKFRSVGRRGVTTFQKKFQLGQRRNFFIGIDSEQRVIDIFNRQQKRIIIEIINRFNFIDNSCYNTPGLEISFLYKGHQSLRFSFPRNLALTGPSLNFTIRLF